MREMIFGVVSLFEMFSCHAFFRSVSVFLPRSHSFVHLRVQHGFIWRVMTHSPICQWSHTSNKVACITEHFVVFFIRNFNPMLTNKHGQVRLIISGGCHEIYMIGSGFRIDVRSKSIHFGPTRSFWILASCGAECKPDVVGVLSLPTKNLGSKV